MTEEEYICRVIATRYRVEKAGTVTLLGGKVPWLRNWVIPGATVRDLIATVSHARAEYARRRHDVN